MSRFARYMATVFKPVSSGVIDSFNRSDSESLGTADTGQVWSGGFGITSNQAHSTVASVDTFDTVDSSMPDCTVSVKMVNLSTGSWSGPCARYTDANNVYWIETNGTTIYLKKKEAGAAANLGSGTGAYAGCTLRIKVNGSSIKAYVDDIEKISATSTFNQTATRHGLKSYTTAQLFDDFKAEAI